MKIGDTNDYGEVITEIIANGEDYFIYRTGKNNIAWTSESDERNLAFTKLIPHVSKLTALVIGHPQFQSIAMQETDRAFQLCGVGEEELACKALREAEQRIKKLRKIDSRFSYLLGGLMIIFLSILITIFLALSNTISQDVLFASLVTTCGSLGGFLSVNLNLNKIEIDIESPKRDSLFAGASRIIIAMIGAIFSFFLIRAGLILGLAAEQNPPYVVLAVSIVAGFSETLVPNLLRKMETQQIGGTTQESV